MSKSLKEERPDIVIATPGRFIEMVRVENVVLSILYDYLVNYRQLHLLIFAPPSIVLIDVIVDVVVHSDTALLSY